MSRRYSVYGVNGLFLLVLVLQSANFLVQDMPQYVRLILNEALLVLLPSLVYLRWAGLPFRETVRLRSPGWRTAVASFFVGAGLYPVSVISGSIIQTLLGYQFLDTGSLLPQTPLEGVLAILAYAVMAPLCEEVFARGIIQRTYEERFGPGRAILFAGGLFIVFHLSLLQGLTIIPLSLALGYVYWRSESLVASILTHFGANAMAALVVTSGVFWTKAPQVLLSPLNAGIGLVLAVAGLWVLRRNTSPSRRKLEQTQPRRFKHAWPLLVAGLFYLVLIGIEFTAGRSPERFQDPVIVGEAQLQQAVEWNYAVCNAADDPVGEMHCRLEPQGDTIVLYWDSIHQAYDVQVPGGRYMGSNVAKEKKVALQRDGGQPLHGEIIEEFDWGRSETRWSFDGQKFSVRHRSSEGPDETFELAFEQSDHSVVLESSSWPWVLSSLPFAPGYVGSAYHFTPYTWRQATQDNGPVLEKVLVTVNGPETLETPTGPMQTWNVTVDQSQKAWYAVDAPHILLKHDNAMETMVLLVH